LVSLLIIVASSIIPLRRDIHETKMIKNNGTISKIMTTKVITVDVSERVEEALRLMIKFDVGSVIVTDKEKPIGIITERDITRAALRGDSLLRIPVRGLMSRPIQSVTPDTEVWKAFEIMLKLGVRRLPVVQDAKLLGMVTEKDLTRWVLRVFYEPGLPEEIRALVQNPEIEALTGRQRCPNCGNYQAECICVRTAVAPEE